MKKLLVALTISLGLLAPLAPRAQAATDVSLNFFYDNLGSEGNWVEVGDYGYCFQPTVAVNNADWRPYADGYWAYTDVGWTWVSYEDFGWATYHYGRWSNLADYGWVWVPGYEWGPAWVSWRTGGDYIGWAPLPATAGRIYEGRAINAQVDVDYDIGPEYYNFVDIRYIGEPVLRGRIVQPSRNVTIINRTVNVTNITYNNSIVYNYGPSYERVNQYSTRPVQRLTLSRETTVANLNVQAGGGRNFNRVNGGQLMVVAPAIQRSQQRIAPKTVKTKIEKPTFERGWRGISNRQQIQAEMKKENAQNVPPPSFQPQKGRKAAAAPAAAAAGTEPASPNQPNEANQAARRERQQARKANAAEANTPETTPNAENAKADQAQREAQRAKRQAQRQEKTTPSDANANSAQPNETKPNEGDRAARRAARENRQKANKNPANAPKAEAADQANQANQANQDSATDGADRNSAREKMKNRREKRTEADGQTPDNPGNKGVDQADQPKADRAPADQEPNPQMDQRRENRREKRAQAEDQTPDNSGNKGADQADQPKDERAPAAQEQNAQLDPRHEARQERRAARRAEPPSLNNQPEAAPQGNRAERNAPQNRPAARAQTSAQEKPAETADDNTPRKPRKKAPSDENKPDQP
ncbi:MAG: DUF6600 domain-containing protein [Chthoniobacterales bacterium]